MTRTSFQQIGAYIAAAFLLLTLLTACSNSATMQANADAYIRAHIEELSPTSAVLGGTFFVTDITWEDEHTALVTYEDGHIQLTARAHVATNSNNTIDVSSFVIVDDYGAGVMSSSSSATSGSVMTSSSASGASMRPLGKEGEFCGGIAGFQCESGLHCQLDGTYPDAGGTCVR